MSENVEQWLDRMTAEAQADLAAVSSAGPGQEHYRGARISRLTKNFQPAHRSGDAAIRESWDLLTARVRDMGENDPVIKKAKGLLPTHIIGSGMQAFANVPNAAGDDLDEEYNSESDRFFRRWWEDEADAEGRMSFGELQASQCRETVNTGNGLMLICQTKKPGRRLPLCVQLLEFEQLDRSKDRPGSESHNRIVNGIELDSNNVTVAYHVLDAHPYDDYTAAAGSKSQRIPAERMLHWYAASRPSAHMGISWFNAMMMPARDLDWYLGNEMTSAAIGALLTAVVKQEYGGQLGLVDDEDASDPYGNELIKLGAGLVGRIGPKDDIKIVESNRPNRDAAPFIKLLLHMQAMATGVSYLRLTSDYTGSSYTAARAAHLDDSAFIQPLQRSYGERIVQKVRRLHDAQCAGRGLFTSVTPRQFSRDLFRYQELDVLGVGREQLDPEAETDAASGRIRNGTSCLKRECGLRGIHWRENLRQLAIERKAMQRLGVVLDFSKGNGGAVDQTNTDGDGQDAESAAGEKGAA